MGWFFGVKLHLVINDRGELLAVRVTPGNVDDRKPVPALVKRLWGKLFGDKGYISKALKDQLRAHGVELITRLKANMKNQLMLLSDKLLLRKRAIIESVIDQLKNISQIEHTRHRSPGQLHGASGCRAACLLFSTQETFARSGQGACSCPCLSITHVLLSWVPIRRR